MVGTVGEIKWVCVTQDSKTWRLLVLETKTHDTGKRGISKYWRRKLNNWLSCSPTRRVGYHTKSTFLNKYRYLVNMFPMNSYYYTVVCIYSSFAPFSTVGGTYPPQFAAFVVFLIESVLADHKQWFASYWSSCCDVTPCKNKNCHICFYMLEIFLILDAP